MRNILARPLSAKEVLDRYWDGSIPVNPVSIARQMGVEVYKQEDLDVDGEFLIEEDGTPTIIVQSMAYPLRARFTIAHELGHFALCHGPSMRDPKKNFNIHNYDRHEVEANAFAADLLMPENVIYAFVDRGVVTLQGLADEFNVSTSAMRIRLERLGIL